MNISMLSEPVKEQLQKRPEIYKFLRRTRFFFASATYLFQSYKPSDTNTQLVLGTSRKIPHWLTFDIVPGADYLGDIAKLGLFPNNSMTKVYASHVLEHVTCDDAKTSLQEIYRILKPDGEIFVAVPDLENMSQLFQGDFSRLALDIVFGVNRRLNDWQPQHKYGYTRAILKQELEEAGFRDVQNFEPFMDDTTQRHIDGLLVSICLRARK